MLRALPAATIEQLGAALEHEEYEPGRAVFGQGDRGETFYIIESGHADVLRDGRMVDTLGRGECFGEIALLRNSKHTKTAQAIEDSEIMVLPKQSFEALLNTDPDLDEQVRGRRADLLDDAYLS